MKLYCKPAVTLPMERMSASGRFVHSYLITGDAGAGKKTCADYIAMQLLCSDKNGSAPCGSCRECSRVQKHIHPDYIIVEKSKKSFSIEDVRAVVEDSYTAPNDCDRKVYLFADCDGWSDAAQNATLKITEDPPDSAYFIFTGQSENTFLSTLRSRSMLMAVGNPSADECAKALSELLPDHSTDELLSAAKSTGGNIGRAMALIQGDEELLGETSLARDIVDSLARGDEYRTAVLLSKAAKTREGLRRVLCAVSYEVRDSAVTRTVSPVEGEKLSRLGTGRLLRMYDALSAAQSRCLLNCNADALSSALCAQLYS